MSFHKISSKKKQALKQMFYHTSEIMNKDPEGMEAK